MSSLYFKRSKNDISQNHLPEGYQSEAQAKSLGKKKIVDMGAVSAKVDSNNKRTTLRKKNSVVE